MADQSALNNKLKANTKLKSFKDDITSAVGDVADIQKVNDVTVLGQEVGEAVNNVKSLDNNKDKLTQNIKGSSAGQVAQVLPGAGGIPKPDAEAFKVGVSAGTATITNVAEQISTLTFDSAGDTIGTESLVGGSTVPTLSMSGTDTSSALSSMTSSLTGIVPPKEPITIVTIGGAVLDELVGAVEEAVDRKSSLLSEIQSTASSATAQDGGLGSDLTSSIDKMKGDLDKAKADIESSKAMTDMAGAVSAVEGVANEASAKLAEAQGGLQGAVDTAIGEVSNTLTAGLPKGESPLGGLIAGVTSAVGDLVGAVGGAIKTGLGTAQDLFEDLTGNISNKLQSSLGGFSLDKDFLSTIMEDVMAGGDINLTKASKSIALKSENTSAKLKKIIAKTDAESTDDFVQKVTTQAKTEGIEQSDIDQFKSEMTTVTATLREVDSTISGSLVSVLGEFYTEDVDLRELAKRYIGAGTSSFPYVSSKEELGLEFQKMTREVSEIVVHASETFTNVNIGAEELNLRHNEAGHDGIQYHLVIRRDGRLQRGMPLDTVSVASQILGHDANCIDVCLIGGVNVATEAQDPELNLSARSFTQAQMKTFEAICESFYHRVPGGQVLGHNDIDTESQDPYMDIISYVENKFGKKSVYKDPLTEQSKSVKELVGAEAV